MQSSPNESAEGSADRPLVSALIPAYNSGDYLAEAIDSALTQDYPAMEVVVADDGSTDTTADLLEDYGDRIRVVRHPGGGNRGLGVTRTLLAREARGTFHALLDADDAWLPGKISLQVDTMLQHPQAALCHTDTELFGDATGEGPIDPAWRKQIDGNCFEALFQRNGICVASVMLRADALPAHGFESDLKGVEDYAMWMHMLVDRPAVYLPRLTTRYRRHASQMTSDGSKRIQIYAGIARLRTLDRHAAKLPADRVEAMEAWVLDELRSCSYSRYWSGDHGPALAGFRKLVEHGRPVPLRHRMRAALAVMIGR